MNKATRFISDILFDKEINLDLFPSKNNDNFWDKFVKIGSSHYVIPALYYKLKERNYLRLLNDKLASYLKEIYTQNLDRNTQLVKEVNEISHQLKSNGIDHVFLKGAALISSIYKDSIGIRMVGDIDILIAQNQIFKAQELIQKNDYKKFNKYNGLRGRHLTRLIKDNKVFALELHDCLVYKDSSLLNHNDFLKRKIIKKVNIPQFNDILYHSILNFQKNDHGSLRASYSFRTLLDVFNITKSNLEAINKLKKSIHIDKFKLVINKMQGGNYKYKSSLFFFNFRLKLKSYSSLYSCFENIFFNIILSINLNLYRLIEFVKIREYRHHVLNKLGLIK